MKDLEMVQEVKWDILFYQTCQDQLTLCNIFQSWCFMQMKTYVFFWWENKTEKGKKKVKKKRGGGKS